MSGDPTFKASLIGKADMGIGATAGVLADKDWDRVRHAVIAYAQRRQQPREVAEDVAQETLVKLLHYVQTGTPASLYGLALKIAKTTLIDRARREGRYGVEIDGSYACDAPLPDKVATDRQQFAMLRAALNKMPPLRRAVLVRRRIDNQSHARIAADLDLSIAAVEKHVVRGLSDLRQGMPEFFDADRRRP